MGAKTTQECPSCGSANPLDARFCAFCGAAIGQEQPEARGEDHGGADPLLGRTVAERYRIEELLGRGGMGVVYRVEHVNIGKLMAMKLLHGALALERDVVKRFQREAEAISKLDHPNTVQIFDFGQSDGMMYLVMEYLSGRDIGQIVREEGPLPYARLARMAVQIASSVQQAHDRGIVHRDLKPENVMVLEGREMPDFVKVLDFGLAKLREDEGNADKSITRAGSILGTPYYMAPEHIRGELVDARSDVYALGALLYKALTGVPPFTAQSPVGVLTMHLTEQLVPPSERTPQHPIPAAADELVVRAMAKDPRDRFQSMGELRAAALHHLEQVGMAEGLETSRYRVPTAPVPTSSGRQRKVATRSDVDNFERRLARRGLVNRLLAATLVLGVAAAGVYFYLHRPTLPTTAETEPNNVPTEANPLPEGTALTGQIGRRLSEEQSDADVYRIENPGGERHTLAFEVSAIPNIDLTVELYQAGLSHPVLSADSAGRGLPEAVPNFVIRGTTHYLRVREVDIVGALPTENVSDTYSVSWRFVDPAPHEETEVNDSLELAELIDPGEERIGYIGWGGDEDTYCLATGAPALVAVLEPVATLDLVLKVVDRPRGAVARLDQRGLGEGERSAVIEPAPARDTCFSIGAIQSKDGVRNDATRPYTFRLYPPDEAPPPPAVDDDDAPS